MPWPITKLDDYRLQAVDRFRLGGIDRPPYTSLLFHGDGSNNGTTITDSSSYGHTVTRNGVVTNTDRKKFGTASLMSWYNTGFYISVATHESFDFGSGPFTVDFWFQSFQSNNFQYHMFHADGTTSAWAVNWIRMMYSTDRKIQLYLSSDGSNWDISNGLKTTTELAINEWHHVALVYDGTAYVVYVNGVAERTIISSTQINAPASYIRWFHPKYEVFESKPYFGWMDEFRISKGIARWTANFTPPTAAYTAD